MTKNFKSPPKVRETIPTEKVQAAMKDLSSYLMGHFDFSQNDIALVGIQTRGVVIAERLLGIIKKEKGVAVPMGTLDVTLYRDDYGTSGVQPIAGETRLDFDINDKKIILVDDVLFTGRTIRAAIDELIDYGRPKSISLLVLVDRGHRELPIQADFAPIKISTKQDELVHLHLQETDGKENIVICEPLYER